MIRILHIVGKMDRAGQETFIMNLYRNINKEKIQFDFIVHSNKQGDYDEEIENMGGKIHYVTPLSKNILKNFYQTKKIITGNSYKVVHRHTANSLVFLDLLAAKVGGAKKIIAHSHNNFDKHVIINTVCRPFLNFLATDRFACSEAAGKWLFGNDKKFKVISNAIDTQKYIFDLSIRDHYQNEFKVKNKFVIGHIGRFTDQKNQIFLIDVFSEILKLQPESKLILIGEGELKELIIQCVNDLNIGKNVIFCNSRHDIPEMLQMMDVFVLPSKYEGFGIVAIEAQAADLPCVFSDAIPSETHITENVTTLSLKESPNKWAKEIMKYYRISRINREEEISKAGFDIHFLIKKFEKFYES